MTINSTTSAAYMALYDSSSTQSDAFEAANVPDAKAAPTPKPAIQLDTFPATLGKSQEIDPALAAKLASIGKASDTPAGLGASQPKPVGTITETFPGVDDPTQPIQGHNDHFPVDPTKDSSGSQPIRPHNDHRPVKPSKDSSGQEIRPHNDHIPVQPTSQSESATQAGTDVAKLAKLLNAYGSNSADQFTTLLAA